MPSNTSVSSFPETLSSLTPTPPVTLHPWAGFFVSILMCPLTVTAMTNGLFTNVFVPSSSACTSAWAPATTGAGGRRPARLAEHRPGVGRPGEMYLHDLDAAVAREAEAGHVVVQRLTRTGIAQEHLGEAQRAEVGPHRLRSQQRQVE